MNSVAHVIEALPRFDPAKATFDAKRLSPANVIASIQQFGCAWIKGLFVPADLTRFDAIIAANIDGIEKVYRDLGFGDEFNIGFPLYFASEANRERAQQLFQNLLSKSLPIVEALHRWINSTHFCFANSQKIARSNAEALWKRCTFGIQR